MESPEGELVFVYGTLRLGASNHHRMAGAECLGPAKVQGDLYKIDWYPGLVPNHGAGRVAGEVYRVSSELLRQLDEFEGVTGGEQDEYRRVIKDVEMGDGQGSQRVWLWEYQKSVKELQPVTDNDWVHGRGDPRGALFLIVAWSPVLCLLIGGLFWSKVEMVPLLRDWGLLVGTYFASIVMIVCGALSLDRNERHRGFAKATILIGAVLMAVGSIAVELI